MKKMKKVLSILLCLCMLVQNLPLSVFAAAEDGLCEHHSSHTPECHYAEAVAGSDCTHVHDGTCGYAEAVDEVLCSCTETDENGVLVHTEGCGYVAPVEGSDCAHVHDGSCGYAEAVEGHPCHYECAECAAAEASEEPSEESSEPVPVCNCGTDDPDIHATTCAVYVRPENPQCFCAEKCTEPNVWCDVCGFDYSKCTGTDTAAAYADGDDLVISGANMSSSTPYLASGSTTASATQPETGGYAYWDAASNTITLNNFTSATDAATGILYDGSAETLRIELVGNNSVTGGNVPVVGPRSGVSVHTLGTNVIFSGDGTLTAIGTGTGNSSGYGVFARGDITVDSGTTLIATAGSSGRGVFAEGSIIVNGGSLTGNGGESGGNGVYADTGITVNGGSLTGNSKVSSGVYADSITVNAGGSLTGNGGESGGHGVFASTGSITVNGGSLTGNGGNSSNSYGVYAYSGSITVNGGSLTGNSSDSRGVAAYSITVENGGIMEATGKDMGVNVVGTSESGGSLTVNGGSHIVAIGGNGNKIPVGNLPEDYYYYASGDGTDKTFAHSTDAPLTGTVTETYFELVTAQHLSDTYTSNGDATHSRYCSCEIPTKVIASEACSGGTATCTSQAVCGACGASYGELNLTNHDENAEYENGFCLNCDAYQPAELVGTSYQITNAGQLYWFAQQVNSGNTAINAELTADIVVNENVLTADGALNGDGSNFRAWTPIGTEDNAYTGEFRGSEHTVSGLYVNGSADYVGLFGYVGSGGIVQNAGVIDSYFKAGSYVGGVAGCNRGTLQYVYNTGNINGSSCVGGVVGENNYIVQYAYNTGTVFARDNAGGVVGENNYILEYAYNTGSASDWFQYGSVTGSNRDATKLKNCYYLADSETDELDGTTAKTAGQFEIGEVAYLLGAPFGQNIGTHVSPVLNLGYEVYQVQNCKNEVAYSNTNENLGHQYENGTCTVCGAACPGHSYENGICTVCGAACPGHSYENGICTVCGAACPGHSYENGVCTICGAACPGHSYENGICTLCGAACAHTGGTATCTTQAVCTVCGISYGELAAHSTTAAEDSAADCNSKAYCSVCDSEYGEVDKTRHDETVAYENGFCPNCDAYEPAELVDGVYQISNAGNLYWFADKVTNENAAYGSADAILTCDIRVNEGTMTEASTDARVWTPIGKVAFGVNIPYTGTFEGNGKTVSGLYFNDTSANFSVGLFSVVGEGGTVRNVGIADSYLCGVSCIGAVAGSNYGTVTGCYNTGTVIGSSNSVGGVVGFNYGTATNCYNTGTVSSTSSVGGVVGSNDGTVTDCHNTSTVSGSSNHVGGVVGSNDGTVTDCHNTGTVSGESSVGGVVGNSEGTTMACYNTGTVSGTYAVGGVAGHNWTAVTNCYNTGTVSGSNHVGGVAGTNWTAVTNCYNTGTVSGTTEVGGVVGYNIIDTVTVTNCYFDSTVYSGNAIGDGSGTATDVEGKSTEQFASGEVAYLLSQGENGSIWGQTIGTDPAPVFSDAKVYYGYTSCGDAEKIYTNDSSVSAEKPSHDYDNGFCPNCDAYEPAELVDGVYQISNAGNLYWFADKVTNENAAYGSADAILTCDIRVNEGTMTEASTDARVWTPIGKIELVGNQVVRYPYTGTFEGNGKTVSGLYFNDTSANFSVGLFSYVGEGGTVRNVGIADSYLCGGHSIGAVAGTNYGSVTGCYNTGTVISNGTAGGVVGLNYGTVTGCYNTGTVIISGTAGGVVGGNSGTLTDCHNTGTVSGTSDVGGVVGHNSNSGTITDCHNTGAVSGTTTVGGVAGSGGIMSNCYNTGTVSGEDEVGGVAGSGGSSTQGCYNTGTVSGTDYVGGVVGHLIGYAILEGCYNTGTVSGTDYVGGVAGYLMGNAILEGCYNTGTVSGEDEVGGVAGYNSATVTNCYFDSTVYTGDAIGTNEGTATNVEGKSTEQFASGEVAYLLSQGENGSIWGQDLDNGKSVQTAPTFTGGTVYGYYASCAEDAEMVYTNDSSASVVKPAHTQQPTYTDNHDGTHSAVYPCCGTKGQPENHTLNPETGKCVCGLEMAEASVTKSVAGGIVGIGTTTYYETLDEAIQAVSNCTAGDQAEVKLLENLTLTETFTISGGVFTLDLNEKNVTFSEGTAFGFEISGGEVTFAGNGTVTKEDGTVITVNTGAVVAIRGGTYDGAVALANYATATVSGGTLKGSGFGIRNTGDLTISGGEVSPYQKNTSNPYNVTAIISSGGRITVTGGTLKEGRFGMIMYQDGTIDLSGFGGAEGVTIWRDDLSTVEMEATDVMLPDGFGLFDEKGTQQTGSIAKGTMLTVKQLHVHDWSYMAEGDTIIAICEGTIGECPEAEQTITICAEGKTYDGTPVTAELEGSIDGVADPEIIYSGNTNAGTYTASIKLGKATATVEFTIAKATPAVAWADTTATVTYTGSAAVITAPTVTLVNGETFSGTISYSYTGTSSGNGLPINAGTYEITASIAAQDNYTAATGTNKLTLTIEKQKITVPEMSWDVPKDAVYSGTAYTAILTGDLPEGVTVTKTGNTATNAGDYTAKAVFSLAEGYSADNYEIVNGEDLTAAWSIAKAPSTITKAPEAIEGLKFNGQDQALITPGKAEGGTMMYSVNGSTWSENVPTMRAPNEYHIYYKVVGDSNHTDYDDGGIKFRVTISKALVTLTGKDTTVTYAGEDIDLRELFEIDENAGEADYSIIGGTGDGTFNGEPYLYKIRKAGTFTVQLKTAATENYAAGEAAATLTVEKGKPTITVSIEDWTYGDKPSAPSSNGPGEVTYTYDDANGTYNSTVPPTDAGSWVVRATYAGNDLYSDGSADARFTIAKKALTIKAENHAITYGDAPAANGITGTGFVNGESPADLSGTLTYSFNYERYGDVGDYTIIPGGLTSRNYEITFAAGVLTVSPKAITVKANPVSKSYGDADPALTYGVSGLVNGDKLEGSLGRAEGGVPGTYAIVQNTLSAGDNYTLTFTGADFTITKRDVTIQAEDQTIIYGEIISAEAFTAENLADGHRVTVTLTPSTAKVTADGTITASTVITADGTDVTANYNVSYVSGKLVIKPDTAAIDDLTGENVTSDDEEVIKAVQEMLENADSLTEEWETIGENCGNLLDRIEEVEAEQKELTDAAAAFDEDTVKSTELEELEQLAEKIEDLLDTENLTEEERTALEAVQEQVDGMIETIEDTTAGRTEASETIEALAPETVTSDDQEDLEQAIETIDQLLQEEHLTEEERKALEDAKAEAEELLEKIESVQDALDTENTEKVENVTADNVKPEDKEALEDAKADLEKALEDNADNYTEAEKQAIQDEIQRIEDAVTALENVEDVTDAITQLPNAVEPDDEEATEKILDAKESYDALTDHEKSLIEEDLKEKLEDLVAALTDYKIVKGDSAKWSKGTEKGLKFVANGPFSKFVGVEVDGKEVFFAFYEAEEGSTIVTLKPMFLRHLETGWHTITILYEDGEATGTFKILPKASSPATGDDSNVALWGGIAALSLLCAAVLILNRKKFFKK